MFIISYVAVVNIVALQIVDTHYLCHLPSTFRLLILIISVTYLQHSDC